MSIAAKEAEETEYWLILCDLADSYPKPEQLLLEIKSIQKLLAKILSKNKTISPKKNA
jgi:four helix bundle protein